MQQGLDAARLLEKNKHNEDIKLDVTHATMLIEKR